MPRRIPPQIAEVLPKLVELAQRTYDAWDQDENGVDDELGEGGICHLIAEEIADELNGRGLEAATINAQVGENHVWAVVRIDSGKDAGVWSIDIPPGVYERGGGYTWRKLPDVSFEIDDINIKHESVDPADFDRFMED